MTEFTNSWLKNMAVERNDFKSRPVFRIPAFGEVSLIEKEKKDPGSTEFTEKILMAVQGEREIILSEIVTQKNSADRDIRDFAILHPFSGDYLPTEIYYALLNDNDFSRTVTAWFRENLRADYSYFRSLDCTLACEHARNETDAKTFSFSLLKNLHVNLDMDSIKTTNYLSRYTNKKCFNLYLRFN